MRFSTRDRIYSKKLKKKKNYLMVKNELSGYYIYFREFLEKSGLFDLSTL
jgi:hypothetical protein